MEIYSLSGASGTGKSTVALQFAHDHHIRAIIDDGLLIIDGIIVAGTSAKFEKTPLRAVRRAILDDEQHRSDMIQAIEAQQLDYLLLIGTSDKMTRKIADRLGFGTISKFFYIEDIQTAKEIQRARFMREIQGQHVMPVPFRQVEQNFFKRLIQRGKDIFSPNRVKLGETTIVKPDFHQQTVTIAKSVYIAIVKHIVENNAFIARTQQIQCTINQAPRLAIELFLTAPVHYSVPEVIEQLQSDISNSFALHFNMEPEEIHVKVLGVESYLKN